MSNILIIKHGSLGDIVQISGVLKDIREHHKSDKIYFMTTNKFSKLFKIDKFKVSSTKILQVRENYMTY